MQKFLLFIDVSCEVGTLVAMAWCKCSFSCFAEGEERGCVPGMHTREDTERLSGFGWPCDERGSAEIRLSDGDQIEFAGRPM